MRSTVELSDIHDVVFVLEHGGLVVVDVEVVWCGEDGHDGRKSGRTRLAVHPVASVLRFVGSDDRKEIVLLEESACGGVREEV